MNTPQDDLIKMIITEITSAFAGNLQRALDANGIDIDGEDVPIPLLATIAAEVFRQNSEVAGILADRFAGEDDQQLLQTCLNLQSNLNAQANLLKEVSESWLTKWPDFVMGSISGLEDQTDSIAIGLGAEAILKPVARGLDLFQMTAAAQEGNLSASLGVIIGSYVTQLAAGVGAGIVIAGGAVSWPLVAVVAGVSSVAGILAGAAADTFIEDMYALAREPEDEREYASRLITAMVAGGGATYLPELGDYLAFGKETDDVLASQYLGTTSSILIGGGGDDLLLGGLFDDSLSGGEGNDSLQGGRNSDNLIGGEGDDILEGGEGSDLLRGGQGVDIYNFSSADFAWGASADTLIDDDGRGEIRFNGVNIVGSSVDHVSRDGFSWISSDEVFRYLVLGSEGQRTLAIVHRESGARILVEGWNNGDLGISLPTYNQPGSPENPFPLTNGDDLIGHDGDDDPGTPVSGDDVISGLAGNDGIDGGYGDDWIDGGLDDDLLLGGSGSNRLIGGLGNDIIINYANVMDWAPWNDPTYGDQFDGRSDAISHGNGWFAYNAMGATDADNAPQHLLGLQIAAWGMANGSPETETVWVDLDPNVFKNGDDDIDAGDGSDTAYGGEGDDRIAGGTGNDLLIGGTDNDFINGEDGDDLILGDDLTYGTSFFSYLSTRVSNTANASGNDVLVGGLGNDRISGQGGTDVIDGGEGDDILSGDRIDFVLGIAIGQPVVSGNDHIDGGAGNDWISGDGGDDTLSGGTGADTILGDSTTLDASEHGKDVIKGDAGNDELYGGGGNDEIDGGSDDDIVSGEDGDDRLQGGAGLDRLIGGLGNDSLSGGDGNDKLWGDEGNDRLSGDAGNDELVGGEGNDSLDGGDGIDKLWGEAGDDSLSGGLGDDQLQGGDGVDSLSGGNGADQLWGDAGNDTLSGGSGLDQLAGGSGNDYLDGGADDDILNGNAGSDTLAGGDGNDNISGNEDADELDGGSGNDYLDGGTGNDLITGADGDDRIYGDTGNDTIVGGTGSDLMTGGDGQDTFFFERGFGNDYIYVYGSDATPDVISFGSSIDASELAYSVHGDDLIIRLAGTEDQIEVEGYFAPDGNNNNSELLFSDGSVTTRAQLFATLGMSTPVVGSGSIVGTEANDSLYGGSLNDVLQGLSGNDYLNGGYGDDVLTGGSGNDTLEGGAGRDTYQFESGFGIDRIVLGDAYYYGPDTIKFGATLSWQGAQHTVNGKDLWISFVHGPDSYDVVILENFFLEGASHVIEFADGTRWTATDYGYGPQWLGTSGDDVYTGNQYNDKINGLGGNDILHGSAGDDYIQGGDGNDTLYGEDGDDRLAGDNGNDEAHGGLGNDVYYGVEDIHELEDEGIDTAYIGDVNQPMTYTLSANVENLIYTSYSTSSYPFTITGNDGDNTIEIINASAWAIHSAIVDGGAGADKYIFGGDAYGSRYITIYVDNIGDTWEGYDVHSGGGRTPGTDRFAIYSTLNIDFQFDQSVREFRSVGTEAITVIGDGRANILGGSANSAANVLIGGGANDTYYADVGDVIVEGAGGGTDTVMLEAGSITGNYTLADNVERLVSSISGVLYGNDEDNRISFSYDIYGGGTLYGGGGADYLQGGSQAVSLYGGTGNDNLSGSSKADVLNGGTGDDEMSGGYGDDEYYVDSVGDVVVEYVDPGRTYDNDKVFSSIDYVLAENVEQLELLAGATSATGNAGYNTLVGNDSDNILEGGLGLDQLHGGLGADTYTYSMGDGWDYIHESENELNKVDVLRLAAGITTADVQVRRTVSDGTYIMIGGERIYISDGIDYAHEHDLNEISRLEQIHFADGTVWNVDEVVQINAPPVLGAVIPRQEVLRGNPYVFVLPTGTFLNEASEPLTLEVNYLPEWLTFDVQTQTFSGTPPVEAYAYENIQITATDTWGQSVTIDFALVVLNEITGTGGADTLTGTYDPDRIMGLAGNDIIDGSGGSDSMLGGTGDDIYTVDDYDDRVIESAGEGNDLVNASVSYVLSDHVERLTLTGSSTIDGTGNALNNMLVGNSRPNTLQGLEGDDTLDGKAGADTLIGGMGNDAYVVDNANDVVVELVGEGLDAVTSSVTHVLAQNVEDLVLSGSNGISGSGNALDNTLTGNGGANTLRGYEGSDLLDGGSGSDTMLGGIGDDTYVVGSTGDVVTELASEGEDTVRSSIAYTLGANVEHLTLIGTSAINGTGNAIGNVLVGNSGNNTLTTLGGNDTLEGKGGTDTLTGGTGNDAYLMARTYGTDTVVENDSTAGNTDVARFLTGITYDQLWFKRPTSSNNLEISIIGTTDKLVIKDWYLGGQYRVEEIRTDDGNRVLYAADVQALVNAMAGMTPPPLGQTTLTTSQSSALAPTFSATWHDQPAGGQMFSSSLPAMASPDMEADVRTKPLMISREGYLGDYARSVSDCHNLIMAMGIAGRFDKEVFNPHANEHTYSLIP